MKKAFLRPRIVAAAMLLSVATLNAQTAAQVYGPYNAVFIADGTGLAKKASPLNAALNADSAWSMYCWVQSDGPLPANTLIAGIGAPAGPTGRFLAVDNGKLALWVGGANKLSAPATLDPPNWHFIAATYDGQNATVYADGNAVARQVATMPLATPVLWMAPEELPQTEGKHFSGKIAGFTVTSEVLTSDQVRPLYQQPPNSNLIEFERGSNKWPVQTRAQAGMFAPQDPATLPRSSAAPSHPVLYIKSDVSPGGRSLVRQLWH